MKRDGRHLQTLALSQKLPLTTTLYFLANHSFLFLVRPPFLTQKLNFLLPSIPKTTFCKKSIPKTKFFGCIVLRKLSNLYRTVCKISLEDEEPAVLYWEDEEPALLQDFLVGRTSSANSVVP